MGYLLTQLFFYIICALLLGFFLGWVIWGWRNRTSEGDGNASLEQALKAHQQECQAEKAKLQTVIDEQAAALEQARADLAAVPAMPEPAPPVPAAPPAPAAQETAGKFTTTAPKPASLYETRPAEVDDLKEIKGIGPVMERILNEKGCYHFKQLANFSPQDIEWVSAAIETFPNRIERDQWVEQAKTLHHTKYGERHDAS